MLSVPPPALDARTVYRTCLSKARPAAKALLSSYEEAVVSAAADYETAARAARLHTLSGLRHEPGGTTPDPSGINDELVGTYTSRMAGKNGPGRDVYNKLLKAAPGGRCPLCHHGLADTLDHQLPKSDFPLLAVTPANLVPVCQRCNHNKLDQIPRTAEEQALHPYFDDAVNDHIWLFARITGPPTPAVTFDVAPPPDMPDPWATRVSNHFDRLDLATLYAAQAGPELRVRSRSWTGLTAQDILGELRHQESLWGAEHLNCWQAALYRALAENPWYIEAGHHELGH
ncbi:HNH endonuclease [Embleya sp. MST-111070]|uniref:HNH endonuclease n=1 Tax=Embleya sp. MST-111070 TaxID=3398231 RepID=UPI003F733C71